MDQDPYDSDKDFIFDNNAQQPNDDDDGHASDDAGEIDRLYLHENSCVTVDNFKLSISALAWRHSLSDSAIKDFLLLFKAGLSI